MHASTKTRLKVAEFHTCSLFSVCHFRSVHRVTFYVEIPKALYVNKREEGGARCLSG